MAYTVNTSAAALNRAFNNANATPTAFAATAAALTADQIAAANTFDDASLTDLALSTKVLTNMGILPSTVAEVVALEAALADYFAGPGLGNRGFVVLQLAEILSGFAATDVFYGAAATAWNAEVAASVADSAPGAFALTTAADVVTGGQADDIITAINAALTASKTLNVTDVITGGAGNDTLKIDTSTTWTGFTTGSVTGVETVEITNSSDAVARSFSAAGITGAKTYTVNAAGGNVTLTDLATGVTAVNLNSLATTASTTFSTAFVTGAAEAATTALTDSVALGLNSVGTSGSTKSVTIDLDKFETVNITASGSNNIKLLGDDAKTVTLNSSGATTIRDLSSALTSFDASASAGAVTITGASSATAAAIKTVKTGAAVDSVTLPLAALAANATIDMGAGATDTLTLSASATRAVEFAMTGVENLTLGTVTSGSTLVFSGAKTTGLTTVETTGAATGEVGTAAGVTFANMGTGALAFKANGASPNVTINSDHTGATTIDYVTALTTSQKNDATTQGSIAATDFVVDSSTGPLTVNFGPYMDTNTTATTQNTISAAKASSVVLNVTTGPSAAGVEKTIWDDAITANVATSVTVNSTGKLASGSLVTAPKATSITVVNGASAGTLELATPKATSVDITTGAAFTTTSSDFTLVDNVKLASNSGHTELPALPAASSIAITGTGTAAQVTLLALGGTSGNDYDMSLTASGLKSDLAVGQVQVAAGYDVTIDVSGVTGDVNFGDINRTGTRGDDVTITATGVGVTFDVEDIYATGEVTVKANNVVGDATIGDDIFGDKVTIDLRGSGSGSRLGSTTTSNITAKTSVDVSIHELTDKSTDTYTINAASGSTALSVNFNGGIVADRIEITGVSTQTAITVTGNMGAGDDTILITSTSGTAAQNINLSAVSSYASSTIYSGSGADTITGGSGNDTIYASAGADTFNGGAGADTFVFGANTSTYLSVDTINGLEQGDLITSGDYDTSLQTDAIASAAGKAAVSDKGVASFSHLTAAEYDSFAEKVALIDAITQGTSTNELANGKAVFFSDSGYTYLFIHTDTNTYDVVVKLAGVPMPAAAVDQTGTGIQAFAA